MSVTYPADATATTYLFTLRGKVNTPTLADARELHNKTAGSADGIAAARALGDLSHNVYTSAGNRAGSDEILIIDYWNSPSGFGQFFADPQVQAGAELLFTEREGILWAPTSGFGDFHLALPSGASPAAVGLLRGSSLAGSGRCGVQRTRRGDDQYRAQIRADRTRDMVTTPESEGDDLA